MHEDGMRTEISSKQTIEEQRSSSLLIPLKIDISNKTLLYI